MTRKVNYVFKPGQDKPGGFEQSDGTIDFYLRIRSLIDKDSRVLDFGAGRAAWVEVDDCEIRRSVLSIKDEVKELVACDVDPVVLENKAVHEAVVIDSSYSVPLESSSFDLIFCDWVLEHVGDPQKFFGEIDRLLKPGGYFCARTPHRFNHVSIFASVVRNSQHKKVLAFVQPARREVDVFPTVYKLNSLRKIESLFAGYSSSSFVFRANPAYFFGREWAYRIAGFFFRFAPSFLVGVLYVFLRKPDHSQ